jgi:hypothetical protein
MLPTFPNPVDEAVARVTAAEVVVVNVVALSARQFWLLPLVAGDYVVRALVGPRFSPLARLAMVLAPRLGFRPKLVAGPPIIASVLALTGRCTPSAGSCCCSLRWSRSRGYASAARSSRC